MKLTGVTGAGTYYSPWLPYTIASFYFCDEIVVVNGGFDIKNPQKDVYNVPLKKVSKAISELDVEGKIIEITGFTINDLKRKGVFSTEKDHPDGVWFDPRGLNTTLANEIAVKRGAARILKFDTDQVGYHNAWGVKFDARPSLVLKQYEFVGDVNHLAVPGPDSPYNDSVFSYPADDRDWYIGGCAPMLHPDRRVQCEYECAHLRHANPPGLSEKEKFAHFYQRAWFHDWSNSGIWGKELEKRAKAVAEGWLKATGKRSTIPPPEVTLMKPREYIEVYWL